MNTEKQITETLEEMLIRIDKVEDRLKEFQGSIFTVEDGLQRVMNALTDIVADNTRYQEQILGKVKDNNIRLQQVKQATDKLTFNVANCTSLKKEVPAEESKEKPKNKLYRKNREVLEELIAVENLSDSTREYLQRIVLNDYKTFTQRQYESVKSICTQVDFNKPFVEEDQPK